MSHADPKADRIVALTLKAGAYAAFTLIVAGLLLQFVSPVGTKVATAGLLVLLVTPLVRVVVAGGQFLHERDFKYALVAAGVLGVMALAYFLGIKA